MDISLKSSFITFRLKINIYFRSYAQLIICATIFWFHFNTFYIIDTLFPHIFVIFVIRAQFAQINRTWFGLLSNILQNINFD